MIKGKIQSITRKRVQLKGVKVTYRMYFKNGDTKYKSTYYAVPIDKENVVDFLAQYIRREWTQELTYEIYQDIECFKLISIDGVKINEYITR